MSSPHNFHIPVLGVGFSVDTPLKVARFGISSVLSIVDDTLLEKLREHYQRKNNREFEAVTDQDPDARANRITAYLNMLQQMVSRQFEAVKNSGLADGSLFHRYFEMLPERSDLKQKYLNFISAADESLRARLHRGLLVEMQPGSIDVNIMTKIDKPNYDREGNPRPVEFNDAHAALRGYANSDLESSIIFSAGMNPRLYGYIEHFRDFLPNALGKLKKKIVIKVSDFRSALTQGKFLAKKGLWVSEFRIESGLNCGGHAFATDGLLLGPIVNEFRKRRDELCQTMSELYLSALGKKEIPVNESNLDIKITVQGGVGTAAEQNFLLRHFQVDSVGWGTPFLLVPEATNVDDSTLAKLAAAGEDDLYLSDVSPLGVPFNNLRNNDKDREKYNKLEAGKPGSPCLKKFLSFNTDYTEKPVCTASIAFLRHKGREIEHQSIASGEKKALFNQAAEKACLCEGLTASALTVNHIDIGKQSTASAVCPGPNMAYFSKIASLKEMVDHIYGRINLVSTANRPNMFIKELRMYFSYLQKKVDQKSVYQTVSTAFFETFYENLIEGIRYYQELLPDMIEEAAEMRNQIGRELEQIESALFELKLQFFSREAELAPVIS